MFPGLRFQKRLNLAPGARLNLSKSGASASLGPRGADVNVGANGVTTNAGIPGTGISYRRKLGGGRGLVGVLALVAGLGWWGWQHHDTIGRWIGIAGTAQVAQSAGVNTAAAGLRYVHRGGSIIRDAPKVSGHKLKKEVKGAQVTLISEGDGWAKVTDGNITGWMRASVLGTDPPN
jgi:hypothetical protein